MKFHWVLTFVAIMLAVAAALVGGCYAHGPNPPPCANIETCGDPTTPSPVWDKKHPDGGSVDR